MAGTLGVVFVHTLDAGAGLRAWIGFEILTGMGVRLALQVPTIENQAAVTSLTLVCENVGACLSIAVTEAAFTHGLFSALGHHDPQMKPETVVNTGATEIRRLFGKKLIQGILMSYLQGCKDSHLVPMACGSAATLVSMVVAMPSSCQLFSSLDGVLALSRDITPLPSVSTSRTTTRHASIIPEDALDQESIRRICEKIDAKLTAVECHDGYQSTQYPFTYGYSYALPASGIDHSPILRSDTMPQMSQTSTRRSESISVPPTVIQGRPALSTVISWTSNATRRVEYEKIDRAHSGVRGFLRRVLPRCLRTKDARKGFFTGECDGDSVRRFRLDVSDDDSDAGHQEERESNCKFPDGTEYEGEKGVPSVETEVAAEDRDAQRYKTGVRGTKAGEEDKPKNRRWSCFNL
ncbi:hypothetical protein AYL99_07926 [Fonsecaea erecta]|uniref:Uncharacterized protein n=1 Tax=Fonsecaea erecta TaxID=1367422 RepID=A0A178ZBQ5_9EURO|nr:hypothetical protein AYL99_07926 [Fonsecaea erecta]OAP57188.1 hypothetical protein AYL99_07926 [Fonsecaea erecta]